MNVWMSVLAVLFSANLATAQDHRETVSEIKAALQAQGADLSGPCGAFKITQRTAWALRTEGAGLHHKVAPQNGCDSPMTGQRYAVDIIVYTDGRCFDILIDAGGQNIPTWDSCRGLTPQELWRPPFPAAALEEPPDNPPPMDLSAILALLSEQGQRVSTLVDSLSTHEQTEGQRFAALTAQLTAHDEEPAWIRKYWKEIVTLVGGLVGGFAVSR